MSIEVIMITMRPWTKEILETMNWQTDKDFTMRLLVRGPQPWTPEELKASLEFPVEVYPQKLYFSTGTRYGASLAWDEQLTYVESDYVLFTEDYCVANPRSIEPFRKYAREDLFIQGYIQVLQNEEWTREYDYPAFQDEFNGIPKEYPLSPILKANDLDHQKQPMSKSHGFRTAFNLFPMDALRRVNGLDVAFDTQWGMVDINLGQRLLRAGYSYGSVAIGEYLFKHKWHGIEKDDPGIPGGFCIYNKETGAKIDNPTICFQYGGATQYNRWHEQHGIIEAPLGLRQIAALMGR